jgi:hypothetical protein
MERNIALTIFALAVLAIGVALLLPGGRQADVSPKLPWMIDTFPDGSSSVFGLTLGRSTLGDARGIFEDEGKITLFATPADVYSVEAFFERIALSGLKADFVAAIDLSQNTLRGMYERGIRLSKLGSGERKVELNPDDVQQLSTNAPIRHLTYLPVVDLTPDLLESRFGIPAQRLPGKEKVVHWLYPDKGLDIAVDPERKEVFQYVAPKDFDKLILAPLQKIPEPTTP